MKFQKKTLVFLLSVAASTLSSVSMSASCPELQAQLSDCNAKLGTQAQEIQTRTTNVQSLNDQIARNAQIRDRDLPACADNNGRRSDELQRKGMMLRDAQRQREEAEKAARYSREQYADVYREKFVKWQCVIKDRKYANAGFGEGNSREAARQVAITSGRIDKQVRDAGSYDFCFEVFKD